MLLPFSDFEGKIDIKKLPWFYDVMDMQSLLLGPEITLYFEQLHQLWKFFSTQHLFDNCKALEL